MQVIVSPFYTITLGSPVFPDFVPAAEPRPTRRTVGQLHRDLGQSRYTGADLRRIRADPHREECSRRRVAAAIRQAA